MNSRKKQQRKSSFRGSKTSKQETLEPTGESQLANTMTIAWTVSLTTLLLCNLTIGIAFGYLAIYPQSERITMLSKLLSFSGTVLGVISLCLLPIVYRVRRVAPPPGLVKFGVFLALSPMLILVLQLFS